MPLEQLVAHPEKGREHTGRQKLRIPSPVYGALVVLFTAPGIVARGQESGAPSAAPALKQNANDVPSIAWSVPSEGWGTAKTSSIRVHFHQDREGQFQEYVQDVIEVIEKTRASIQRKYLGKEQVWDP